MIKITWITQNKRVTSLFSYIDTYSQVSHKNTTTLTHIRHQYFKGLRSLGDLSRFPPRSHFRFNVAGAEIVVNVCTKSFVTTHDSNNIHGSRSRFAGQKQCRWNQIFIAIQRKWIDADEKQQHDCNVTNEIILSHATSSWVISKCLNNLNTTLFCYLDRILVLEFSQYFLARSLYKFVSYYRVREI